MLGLGTDLGRGPAAHRYASDGRLPLDLGLQDLSYRSDPTKSLALSDVALDASLLILGFWGRGHMGAPRSTSSRDACTSHDPLLGTGEYPVPNFEGGPSLPWSPLLPGLCATLS